MKIGKLILVTLLVSAYATITVVHINMAQPKPVAEATLDMIEIMTRAFDESEGGESTACVILTYFPLHYARGIVYSLCYYNPDDWGYIWIECGVAYDCVWNPWAEGCTESRCNPNAGPPR